MSVRYRNTLDTRPAAPSSADPGLSPDHTNSPQQTDCAKGTVAVVTT